MKKGAGSDPFANGDDDGGVGDSESDEQDDVGAPEHELRPDPDVGTEQLDGDGDDTIVSEPPQASAVDSGVPWVYTRSNVKQDRDMVQFYLREFVRDAEEDLVDAVGDGLGTDVSKTDVREAAYVAAMRRPEIVAEELERWGFESE